MYIENEGAREMKLISHASPSSTLQKNDITCRGN